MRNPDDQRQHELYLTELFTSVQGESSLAGLPTVFVRLSGCPLRCSWCDTPYSFSRGQGTSIQSILEYIENSKINNVCVTGGEPLAQKNALKLLESLCDAGLAVSLETSGAISTAGVPGSVKVILDIKCPSSGESDRQLVENYTRLRSHDEVKCVIADRKDYDYALAQIDSYRLDEHAGEILFSPVHGHLEPQLLVEWMLHDSLPYRLNLQLHKYIWTPTTRGV